MHHCFVWVDFGCVNQDGNPADLLQRLDLIMEIVDCVFTPIVDPDWQQWELSDYYDIYEDYKAKHWNDGKFSYVNRGWCRIEMFYAANIPLLVSSVERKEKFTDAFRHHLNSNRRMHFLYGHYEDKNYTSPVVLSPMQNSYFEKYYPLEGFFCVDSDKEIIIRLVNALEPYMIRVTESYEGEKNTAGEMHGYGIHRISNGGTYEGFFEKGKRNGHGILKYENGDVYEGEFCNDYRNGYGVFRYANGNVYRGGFINNKKHAQFGVFKYGTGDLYVGEFKDDKKDGKNGKFTFPSDNTYKGDYKNGFANGYGTFTFNNGDVFEGGFKNNKANGHGVMKHANGDIFECDYINGRKNGHGIMKFLNGDVVEDEYLNDGRVPVKFIEINTNA
jgi:hypothetical protein